MAKSEPFDFACSQRIVGIVIRSAEILIVYVQN